MSRLVIVSFLVSVVIFPCSESVVADMGVNINNDTDNVYTVTQLPDDVIKTKCGFLQNPGTIHSKENKDFNIVSNASGGCAFISTEVFFVIQDTKGQGTYVYRARDYGPFISKVLKCGSLFSCPGFVKEDPKVSLTPRGVQGIDINNVN